MWQEPPSLEEHIGTIVERTQSGEMTWTPVNGDRRQPEGEGLASKLALDGRELPVQLYKRPIGACNSEFYMLYVGNDQKNSFYKPVKELGRLLFKTG